MNIMILTPARIACQFENNASQEDVIDFSHQGTPCQPDTDSHYFPAHLTSDFPPKSFVRV
jgi:hypothetical protein